MRRPPLLFSVWTRWRINARDAVEEASFCSIGGYLPPKVRVVPCATPGLLHCRSGVKSITVQKVAHFTKSFVTTFQKCMYGSVVFSVVRLTCGFFDFLPVVVDVGLLLVFFQLRIVTGVWGGTMYARVRPLSCFYKES